MKPRFAVLVLWTAVVGLVGCGGDEPPPVNAELVSAPPEGSHLPRLFEVIGAHITHGPILGRLSHDGVGVWVRTSKPCEFVVRYRAAGEDEEHEATGQTHLEHDNTGWVHLQGLESNTEYTYTPAVPATGAEGPGGRFRTLPDGDDLRNAEHNPRGLFNFRFEYGCGNNQNPTQSAGPELPGFQTMVAQLPEKIYFQIMNGDWIYEDGRDTTVEEWQTDNEVADEDVPEVVRIAPPLVGVWKNYKLYLDRGKPLREWHRNVPAFFTFDDHEILNDVWGAGTPGLRDRRAVFRDIGVQAWRDYLGWSNPLPDPEPQGITFGRTTLTAGSDVLEDPAANFSRLDLAKAANLHVHWGEPTAGINDNALDEVGGHPAAGVYEIAEILDDHRLRIEPAPVAGGEVSYSIGMRNYYRFRVSNCDFFLLDTRTHRQMHDTRHPDKKGLSMLGPRQKKWLMEGMRASDADFLFVVSSVNFMIPHVGGGAVRTTNKDDAWTVFLDEREQLIDFWDHLGEPVFVLTGDLHNSFAIKITDRVWEFASGPHNSQNHWYTDEGDRPPSGDFESGGRKVNIRWSTFWLNDIPRENLRHPHYCVVQVNNVFNNPREPGEERWVAFPQPQVVFQYFDGRTGELRYAEAIAGKDRGFGKTD